MTFTNDQIAQELEETGDDSSGELDFTVIFHTDIL